MKIVGILNPEASINLRENNVTQIEAETETRHSIVAVSSQNIASDGHAPEYKAEIQIAGK